MSSVVLSVVLSGSLFVLLLLLSLGSEAVVGSEALLGSGAGGFTIGICGGEGALAGTSAGIGLACLQSPTTRVCGCSVELPNLHRGHAQRVFIAVRYSPFRLRNL